MQGSGDMTAAFSAALESANATPAAESSPDSTPVPESSTAPVDTGEATAAATAQPVAETTETAPATTESEPKKEPPTWRWQDILENARKEHYQRGREEIEKQYEWAKAITEQQRHQLPNALQWAEWLDRDPRGAYAWLGQQLGTSPAPAPTGPDPEPEPDAAIQLADGSQVPVFSPEGMKKREAWFQKQLESRFEEKFKPALTTADQLAKLQEQQRAQQASQQWATTVLAPIANQPHFAEFKPELGKALSGLPQTATDAEMQQAVIGKYLELLAAKHDADLKQAPAKAAAELQQRAVAGTTNPNSASTGSPKKFQPGVEGFKDALAHFGAEAR